MQNEMHNRNRWRILIGAFALLVLAAAPGWRLPVADGPGGLGIASVRAADAVTVTVDASREHQRLEGFGQASGNALVHPGGNFNDSLRAMAIDAAYHQVGINMGNAGSLLESRGGWGGRQNDNGDPFTVNWKGFDAQNVNQIKKYVIDLAKPYGFTSYYLGGETPNVRWASPWLAAIRKTDYNRFLDEAAEQVLAGVSYWKNTYGEELPYYQLGNEQLTGNHASMDPVTGDYGGVDGRRQIVDLVKRAGALLRKSGFLKTRFVVAAEETEEWSLEVASAVLADPEARPYVAVIGYHAYPYKNGYSSDPFILSTSGAGAPDMSRIGIRNRIRDLARQFNVAVWMTENSNSGDPLSYDNFRARAIHIHDEFVYADASAYFCMLAMWDEASQRAHTGGSDNFLTGEGPAVLISNSKKRVYITGIGHAIGHYARWAKPGAIRVDSQSSNPLVQATAFRDDAGHRLAMVLINNAAEPLSVNVNVRGFDIAGSVAGEQSTPAAYWTRLAEFPVDAPAGFHLSLPGRSVTSVAAMAAQ